MMPTEGDVFNQSFLRRAYAKVGKGIRSIAPIAGEELHVREALRRWNCICSTVAGRPRRLDNRQ